MCGYGAWLWRVGFATILYLAVAAPIAHAGEAERWTQEKLNVLGYDVGAADGVLGPRSLAALRAFKAEKDLPADDAIDQPTIDALNFATICENGAYKSDGEKRLFNAVYCNDLDHLQNAVADGLDPATTRLGGNDTLLIIAAFFERPEFVQPLLDAGADIDAVNDHGLSALMVAASYENPKTARALVEAGADRYISRDADTAVAFARRLRNDELVAMLRLDYDPAFRTCVSETAGSHLAGLPVDVVWLADTGELHMTYDTATTRIIATGTPRHVLGAVDNLINNRDTPKALTVACAAECGGHCEEK